MKKAIAPKVRLLPATQETAEDENDDDDEQDLERLRYAPKSPFPYPPLRCGILARILTSEK
jgi:hypothetical protein